MVGGGGGQSGNSSAPCGRISFLHMKTARRRGLLGFFRQRMRRAPRCVGVARSRAAFLARIQTRSIFPTSGCALPSTRRDPFRVLERRHGLAASV